MKFSNKANANAILILMGFMILAVILITVFSPTEYRKSLLNESYSNDYGNVVVFEAADVVIEENELNADIESIYLHDAELDYAAYRKEEQIASSFEISNSFIEDNSAKFYLNVDDSFQGMYFTFYVVSREGNGNIKILLNEEQINSVSPDEGERVTVNVPKNVLKKGENEIIIRATYPINVFSKNSFSLVDLRAYLTERNEKPEVESTFILDDLDFENPVLYAYVTKMAHSTDNSKMKVSLNEHILFDSVPSIINDYKTPGVFKLPLEKEILEEGVNEILWSVSAGGAYSVDFVKIEYEVFEEENNDGESVFRFNINSDDYKKVRSSRYSCALEFESGDVNEVFDFNLNGNSTTAAISFSEVSFDVCGFLKEGLNTLKVSSEEDLLFSKVKLEIKR